MAESRAPGLARAWLLALALTSDPTGCASCGPPPPDPQPVPSDPLPAPGGSHESAILRALSPEA